MAPVGSLHEREYRSFVKKLRAVREAAGMSQEQVARAMGRSQRFVSHCEVGNRRVDVIEFRDFCKVYGVRPQDLLDGFAG